MQAAVWPDDAKFLLEGAAGCHGVAQQAIGTRAVVGVQAGQSFSIVHWLRLRTAAAQQPHLFVPVGVARTQIELPGTQSGRPRRQGHVVLRAFQRAFEAVSFSEVDDHAKAQRPVAAGFQLRMRTELPQLAVGAQHAETEFKAFFAALQPAPGAFLDAPQIVRVGKTVEPLPHRRHRLVGCQADHGAQLFAPGGEFLPRLKDPVTDAGGAGHGLETAPDLVGAPPLFLAVRHVQRHTQVGHGLAGGVAQHQAAQQLRAPATVGMAVARFHIHGLLAVQRRLDRCQHARQVFGVDECAHLRHRQPFGAGLESERQPAVAVVVQAIRAQVMAPEHDAAQFDRQRELRLQFAGRCRQPIGLAVALHHAQRFDPLRRLCLRHAQIGKW